MGGSAQLDDLYKLPPEEFTAARNALAKTLTGDAAREVKALRKPNAVAWSVNQLYWRARPIWEALMKAGGALREAQLGALKGKKSDVRAATEKHRDALTRAVKRAHELASAANVNPNTDQLARMLDALSLSSALPDDVGRFAEVIQPSGFDALAGVKPAPPRPPTARDEARKQKEKAAEHARRQADARLETATAALERAREKADTAKRALNRADADVGDAEREVDAAQAALDKVS